MDRKKVKKALRCCAETTGLLEDCKKQKCPYLGTRDCMTRLCLDAEELLDLDERMEDDGK